MIAIVSNMPASSPKPPGLGKVQLGCRSRRYRVNPGLEALWRCFRYSAATLSPSSSAPRLYDSANVRPRTDSVKFVAEVHALEADAQKAARERPSDHCRAGITVAP